MKKVLPAALLCAAALLLAVVFALLPFSAPTATSSSPAALRREDAAPTLLRQKSSPKGEDFSRRLVELLSDLRTNAADSSRRLRNADFLRDMERRALAGEPSAVARAIVAELDRGEDALTGLGFVVGAGGALAEQPTYRTALLDVLGRVDPRRAAEYARSLVRDREVTPDEYAISLRNLAHGPRDEFPLEEVRGAFAAMLARTDWASAPTTGFLEAFDVAVPTVAFSELASLIIDPGAGPESSLGRAAFIAVDRMMLSEPRAMVDVFRADQQTLSAAPFHRASLLSRLDVRDPIQQSLLKDYLLRADHAAGELDYFVDIYPNGNAFAGYTLVTRGAVSAPSMAEMSIIDTAALQVLRAWALSPDFSSKAGALRRAIARLEGARPIPTP